MTIYIIRHEVTGYHQCRALYIIITEFFCTLKRDDMQKRSRESLFLMICTQTSCVMIYHYSVMDKKMTAILYQNYSHFLVRTTGLVGRETSVIAIVAQYAPIVSAARVQVANIVCRQLKNCRKSVAVTKKDERSRLFLVRSEIPQLNTYFVEV